MKKAYKIALFAALILLSLPSHAQYFDWVKSYSGQDPAGGGYANFPVGIVHDSEGNIYYLGQFGVGACIDTTHFLPFAPSGPGIRTTGVVLAKFSPNGELLWHKTIYSNNGKHSTASHIQMMGDTAISCMVGITNPNGYSTYTFFIDTLLTEYGNYFVDNDSIDIGKIDMFLTFNLNGTLIDRHSLQTAYIDTTGNLIMSSGGKATTKGISAHHFAIDNDGNIVIIRSAQDYVSSGVTVADGTVAGLRFIVDGDRYFDYYPQGRPQGWEHMIVKFSPQFNELQYAQYFIRPEETHTETTIDRVEFTSLLVDANNDYYISGYVVTSRANLRLSDDTSQMLTCQGTPSHGFVVKYYANGETAYLKQFTHSSESSSKFMHSAIDTSDMTLTIPVTAGDDHMNLTIDDTSMDISQGVCFVRLNADNGEYLSHGCVTSSEICDLNTYRSVAQVTTNNNRIALQIRFRGELSADGTVWAPSQTSPADWSYGVMIWGSNGNALQYIDYAADGSDNYPGPCLFFDSTLYLSGKLSTSASFGSHSVLNQGSSVAYLARYVDTAFLTPYRSDNDTNDNDTNDISIVSIDDDLYILIYPNPVQTELHISNIQEPVTSAFITSVNGYRKQVPVKDNAIDFRTFASGVYFLEIVTMDNKVYSAKIIKR